MRLGKSVRRSLALLVLAALVGSLAMAEAQTYSARLEAMKPSNKYFVTGKTTIEKAGSCTIKVSGKPVEVNPGDSVTVTVERVGKDGYISGSQGALHVEGGAYGSVSVNGGKEVSGYLDVDCTGSGVEHSYNVKVVVGGATTLTVDGYTWSTEDGSLKEGDEISVTYVEQFAIKWDRLYPGNGVIASDGTANSVKIDGQEVPEVPLFVAAVLGLILAPLGWRRLEAADQR